MRLLILLLALQNPATPSRATSLDSVVARDGLMRALSTLDSLTGDAITQREGLRVVTQLHLWGMTDAGTRAAFRLDSMLTRPNQPASHWLVSHWIVQRALVNDTATVEMVLSRSPVKARDDILAALARDTRYSRPAIATRYEQRITRPSARAEQLRIRASLALSRQDTVAARQLLEESVLLTRGDTAAGWAVWQSMVQVLQLGGEVVVDEIVRAAESAMNDGWTARTEVAGALLAAGRNDLARVIIDSLPGLIASQTLARRPSSRATLHLLRGTASDSALARSIADSLSTAWTTAHGSPYENLDGRMVSRRDTVALKSLLARDSIDDRIILQLVASVRSLVTAPVHPYRGPAALDSLRPFVRVAIEHLPRIFNRSSAVVRDSMLAVHVAAIAFIDVEQALRAARSIPTARFRERATAEVAARLARTDADRGVRVADGLQDSVARGIAYGPLSLAATAGARFAAAAELANQATGEARVRGFHDLAMKERENALLAQARRHVSLALQSLTPIPRCIGCVMVFAHPPPEPVIAYPGMDARLIADVVYLAVELGERELVARWATSRPTARERTIANLALIEGLSRHLLGWRQSFPMH